jgi:hypothetical protein
LPLLQRAGTRGAALDGGRYALIADDRVPDAVYEEVRKSFSDDELLALMMAVAMINVFNRLNIALRTVSGMYQADDPAIEQLRAALAS